MKIASAYPCPACGHSQTEIIDARAASTSEGELIPMMIRRRRCVACRATCHTYESSVDPALSRHIATKAGALAEEIAAVHRFAAMAAQTIQGGKIETRGRKSHGK